MLPERAYELLSIRRETVAAKGGPAAKRTAGHRPARRPDKKSAAKTAPQEGSAAKRSVAKKSVAEQP